MVELHLKVVSYPSVDLITMTYLVADQNLVFFVRDETIEQIGISMFIKRWSEAESFTIKVNHVYRH